MTSNPRDPVTDPRQGDFWLCKDGTLVEVTAIDDRDGSLVARNLHTGFGVSSIKEMRENGLVPAVVIPLEIAQRMIKLGDAVRGGAGYIAQDLAPYMPGSEVDNARE
jgi:hypothetical protein